MGLTLSCLSRYRSGKIENGAVAGGRVGGWPVWYVSALLLLDLMAQPVFEGLIREDEEEDKDKDKDGAGEKDEKATEVSSRRGSLLCLL